MVKFEKLVNFRDLGGIKNKEGKVIKQKRILRSGELFELSDHDKKLLRNEYNLKHIIDFRSSKEANKSPDDKIDQTFYHHIDIMKQLDSKSSKYDLENNVEYNPETLMCTLYENIIFDDEAKKGYREFIDILLEEKDEASLFHCFAGKDRTGIGGMIILSLLDVDKEEIIKDYEKTIEDRKEANDQLFDYYRALGKDDDFINRMKVLMSVKRDYLDHIYKIIDEKYGSVVEYVKQEIKVTDDQINQLKNNYLI